MKPSSGDAFERVFSHRDFFRGSALRALICGILAAVVLLALLFAFYLLADLLETGGKWPESRITLSEFHQATFQQDPPERLTNLGLIPTAYRHRGAPFAPLLNKIAHWTVLRENISALMMLVLAGIVLGLLRSIMIARAARFAEQSAMESANRLRLSLHRQALRLGPSELSDDSAAPVLALFTTDANTVRDGVSRWIFRIARCPAEIILLVILAMAIHWRIALECLIPLAGCWYLIGHAQRRAGETTALIESRSELELKRLAESFRKTRLVRGYALDSFEHEQFKQHLDRYHAGMIGVHRGERISRWTRRVLLTLAVSLVVFLVGIKVLENSEDQHRLYLSSAVLLIALFGSLYFPVQALTTLSRFREEASLAADRLFRYLNRIPEVGQAVGAKFLQPLAKLLTFESVVYAPPGRPKVLNGLDLRVPAGETVCLVSLNPLEPRAICSLIPRFIEPQAGRILIDGEDIAWVTLESLRAEALYVGGADPVFTGSVRENLAAGGDYSLQKLTEAAKAAHAHNFIVKLPQGYETILGEHGEQLDAGQAFRLGLARALVRNPALLLIEEPDLSLDADTKSLLEDAYQRIFKDRTTLIIPSRLSTVRKANRIFVLQEGRVESIGRHEDLVKNSTLYRHWEYIKFNEFRDGAEAV